MQSIDLVSLGRLGQDEGLVHRLLDLLLQQIPSGLLILDAPGGQPMLSNQQMRAIWGAEEGELERAPLTWVGYRSDGTAYQPGDWPHARALAGESVMDAEEIEIVRADGTRGLVRMTAVPLTSATGEVLAVLVNCLDVSEGRRGATSQRFLADANRMLSTSVDYLTTLKNVARLAVPTLADWCTVDLLNDSGSLRRVAVEHADERKAKAASELASRHPPLMDGVAGVARAVREGESELISTVTPDVIDRVSEGPAHRRLLEELGINSVMFVPLIARGRTLGAIGFVAAESKRRYTEWDLEVAEELAAKAALAIDNARLFDESRAASEAKSDFLAIMSHELRTPLTAIIGYSELLQLGVPEPVTPRQYEQAERIEVSARHLLQLIEEILTLVSLDSGDERIRSRTIDVNELVTRAAGIIEPIARAKGLPIRVETTAGSPTIDTDPEKLLQILLNLLSNAVKFTERGEIELSVRLEGETCTFAVSDTGIGLDASNRARIFEPFWQVERPITRKAGGTGLGLTIARRLTDMLQGRISLETEVGKGSTFRVDLPLRVGGEHTKGGTTPA